MILFASVVTSLTAFMALYYAIHHLNIRLFSRFEGFYFSGVYYWNGFLNYGYTNELRQACDCEIVLAFDMSRDMF